MKGEKKIGFAVHLAYLKVACLMSSSDVVQGLGNTVETLSGCLKFHDIRD